MTTITQKERAMLRSELSCHGETTLRLLDALEAAEARANCAEARCKSALALYEEYHDTNIELRNRSAELERQRYRLAENRANSGCPHECPSEDAPDLEVCDQCWLEWAAQEGEE